ncbi:MAG: hypothetical protein JWM81_400 [Candidatus Saccharibacteria bacterium]|nr:hypothetical protein [Candidatus Saccharibacteria bacterium]
MQFNKIWRPTALLLTLAVVLGSGVTGTAKAAGGNGLRVSPVRTELTIDPGKSEVVNITVTNVTTAKSDLQAVVNDFAASSDESGQPAIVRDGASASLKHSLRQYVQAIPKFSLQPGEQRSIPVTIKIPANAAGGGYYGSVLFAPADADPAGKNVYLAGSVGSLILVRVSGDVKSQLNLASFDTRRKDDAKSLFTSNKGIDAVVRFRNEGNIQEQPFGKILLKNRSGKILDQYEINNTTPRGNVLPDSIRKFTIPLNKVGSFGIYKLEGNFGYGSNGQLLSASTTFYVIPTALIALFIVLAALIVFLIFGLPRLIRRYNQRIIRQASRRR